MNFSILGFDKKIFKWINYTNSIFLGSLFW
jgi:hypothetical protein